jgi:hypothetical protein
MAHCGDGDIMEVKDIIVVKLISLHQFNCQDVTGNMYKQVGIIPGCLHVDGHFEMMTAVVLLLHNPVYWHQ